MSKALYHVNSLKELIGVDNNLYDILTTVAKLQRSNFEIIKRTAFRFFNKIFISYSNKVARHSFKQFINHERHLQISLIGFDLSK